MAVILYLPIISLMISLMSGTHAAAQNLVRLPVSGGPGGDYFQHICKPGRVLVGVSGWSGVWIDSVGAVCARVDGNVISDAQLEGQAFGSGGGERPQDISCPNGTVVAAMEVESNYDKPFVGSIKTFCANFVSRGFLPNARTMRGTGLLQSESGQFRIGPTRGECPADMVAVGIHGQAGRFLDAIGLICGPKPAPPPDLRNLLGQEVSFQSFSYQDRYIRHRGSLGYIEPATEDLGRKDATFKIVPGLAGRCASFESHNYPGHFLRHHNFRLKLAKRTDDELFRQDTTFCIVRGLAHTNEMSFQSVNAHNHYIRHSKFELWVHRFNDNDLFRKDATFQIRPPLAR